MTFLSLSNSNHYLKFFIIATFVFFFYGILHAQSHMSTQAHEDAVSQLTAMESSGSSDDSFFSAGTDGFLIKWTSDGIGEHYQLSELQIKMIARNPSNSDIAVYESDGVSINRVSVWDWHTLTRKYAKRFSDTITSLSYSEKGNYLIIGTAAVNGVFFLNASSGSIAFKPNDIPSIISMAKTSSTEKNVILYSPSGSLIYYDIQNKKLKAKFKTESQLTQPILFGTGEVANCFFAGVKNNIVYIIHALSGKTIAQYQAQKALIFSSSSDNEQYLYFTSMISNGYALKAIDFSVLKSQIKATSDKIFNPPAALIVKTFTSPKNKDSFTCAAKNSSTILLGTQSGTIYKMNDVVEAEMLTLFPMTEKMYDRIYDISSDGSNFYFLTKTAIYTSSYDTGTVNRVGNNTAQTNLIQYKNGVILWSKGSRKPVQFLTLAKNSTVDPITLFTPTSSLQNVRLFGDKIVYIQGNSSVAIFDMTTMQANEVYNGTSIQDAVLYNDTDLYVAKTATVAPLTPLVQVNIATKETVPLKISGTIAYSLSYDETKSDSPIYGITVTINDDGSITKVFSFSPSQKTLTNLLQLSDEDPNAFTALHYPTLYTNIGKSNVRSYNLVTYNNFQFKRSASMPVKMDSTPSRVAVLNRDGSISWYNPDAPEVLADWYLTVDGQWFEF
jgi:hypothetical protein